MRRITGLIACGVLGLILVARADEKKVSTGDERTDEMMVAVQGQVRDVKACTARLLTVFRLMGQEVEDEAEAFFMAPDRIRLTVQHAGKTVPTMVSDGGVLWMYDPEEQLVTKFNRVRIYRETEREVDAFVPDPLRPFRGLKWSTIRYVGEDTLENVAHRVFEAEPLPNLLSVQLPERPQKVRLAIHAGDGLTRAVSVFDAAGAEIIARQFEGVKAHAKLDGRLFEFVIPANVHVIDATDETVGLLKATGGP